MKSEFFIIKLTKEEEVTIFNLSNKKKINKNSLTPQQSVSQSHISFYTW